MTELDRMLDMLEDAIRSGKKTMFSSDNFRLVDEFKCLEYINQIRNLLPSALSEARVIMQDRNGIIDKAHQTADEIVAGAQAEAQRLVDENAIIAEATRRGQEVYDEAVAYASNMINEVYRFVATMTDEAYASVNKAVQAIADTRRNLDNKMRSGPQGL